MILQGYRGLHCLGVSECTNTGPMDASMAPLVLEWLGGFRKKYRQRSKEKRLYGGRSLAVGLGQDMGSYPSSWKRRQGVLGARRRFEGLIGT